MKILPQTLRKNGFIYSQVLRGKKALIYKQRISDTEVHFEVFHLKVKPERRIEGKILESTEVFPHNEAFGIWAWTYRDYEDAFNKWKTIEDK